MENGSDRMKDKSSLLDTMKHPWINAAFIAVMPLLVFGLIDWVFAGPSFHDKFDPLAQQFITFSLMWGSLNWWRARKHGERQDNE